MIKTLLTSLLMLIFVQVQAQVINVKSISDEKSLFLDRKYKTYKVLSFDTKEICTFLHNDSDGNVELILDLESLGKHHLQLHHVELTKPGSIIRTSSGKNIQVSKSLTYAGLDSKGNRIALTAGENMFFVHGNDFIIESIVENQLIKIVYANPNDVKSEVPAICGVDDATSNRIGGQGSQKTRKSNNSTCTQLDLFIAADFSMFSKFNNNIQDVMTHIEAIYNLVQLDFNQFCISFNIEEWLIIDESDGDPWPELSNTPVNASTILDEFCDWTSIVTNPNQDINQLWTDKDICGTSCGTVGRAFNVFVDTNNNGMQDDDEPTEPSLCTESNCNVIEDFVNGDLQSLRVLVSHELGHNFGLNHNFELEPTCLERDPLIMDPSIIAPLAKCWSTGSEECTIENHTNILTNTFDNASCLSPAASSGLGSSLVVCSDSDSSIDLASLLINEDLNGTWTSTTQNLLGLNLIDGTLIPDGNQVGTYTFTYTVNGPDLSITNCPDVIDNATTKCETMSSVSVVIEECADCTISIVNDVDVSICSGGNLSSLTNWISDIERQNQGTIMYSSQQPIAGSVMPNGFMPNGMNSTCNPVNQATSAYFYCDVDEDGSINAGDTYELISSYTLTVYPQIQAPTVTTNGCILTITGACPDDIVTLSGQTIPGGNIADNGTNTVTYTSQLGDQVGIVSISAASGLASTLCNAFSSSTTTPACPQTTNTCPTTSPTNATASICSPGPLNLEITSWQSDLETANSTAISDNNTHIEINYSTEPVPSATPIPNNLAATGIHSDASSCGAEDQLTYAYLQCFGSDGIAGTTDDEYILVGTQTLTVYPEIQAPIGTTIGCMLTVTGACPDDIVTLSGQTIPGGTITDNGTHSVTYTSATGDPTGSVQAIVTSSIMGVDCEADASLETPSCEATAALSDPCACTNPQNYILNGDYYFKERVEVTGLIGQTWNLTSVLSGAIFDMSGTPISLPLLGIESPLGSGLYQFEFWHLADDGFCVELVESGGMTLDICNSCSLPDAILPLSTDLGMYSCMATNIPSCPTTISEAMTDPYNLTLNQTGCDDLLGVSCTDSEVIDCDSGVQTITRCITIFDDLNDNGMQDSNEAGNKVNFTFNILPVTMPTVRCTNISLSLSEDGLASLNPLDVISNTGGFCSDQLTFSASKTNFDCDDLSANGMRIVEYVRVTVSDNCNNSASCQSLVSLMPDYMLASLENCSCDVGRNFTLGGREFFHQVEKIVADEDQNWQLRSITGNAIFDENGNAKNLPLIGDHIGCGIYIWEYWHTNEGAFEAEFFDPVSNGIRRFGRN